MQYNLYFEYSSLLFILPFFVITLSKKRLPDTQNIIYSILVFSITVNIVLNILSALALQYYTLFPLWSQYLLSAMFLAAQAINTLLLFLYILAITGKFKTFKKIHFMMTALPCLATVFLILTSFSKNTVFSIYEGIYDYGTYHKFLYFNSFIYIGLSLFVLVFRSKYTEKNAWLVMIIFLSLLCVALAVQYIKPEYLLANTAGVLGIILVYVFLHASGQYIDKTTRLFNHNAMPAIVSTFYNKKKSFFLVVLTIDEYKNIRKLFGTKSNSRLIAKISEYLTQVYGKDNVLRLNSEQIGIFYFKQLNGGQDLKNFVASIPYSWSVNQADIKISFSAVCLSSRDYIFTETFLNNADYAMTYCRQLGGDVYFLDKKANEQIQYRFKAETLLKKALDNASIEVYFQPIYNNEKNIFSSLEALARMYDEDLGFIPPSVFIPIAEQNGMITRLGEIVLEKVCMLLKMNDLKALGIDKIDVNLSVAQCMQTSLNGQINNIINKYGIDRSLLCFEVTETAATTSFSSLKHNMDELSKTGITFALDDYGMGYSSLNYLMKLPFSYLKTDKELLWSAVDNPRNEVLFECIVYMAEKLDLQVISEGAETEGHLEFLKRKNVPLVQGFYYAKPMKAHEMLEFIKKHNLVS